MSASYYVYYRTQAEAGEVQRVVAELQRLLERETGVRGRLMRRADDPSTWMEIYEGVVARDAFERAALAAVERSGFARLLEGDARRHVERFVAA